MAATASEPSLENAEELPAQGDDDEGKQEGITFFGGKYLC